MKAERRHDLQTNSLAKFIENLPLYFRFHLNKILFGLLVLMAVFFLLRYRTTSAQQTRQMAHSSLRSARDGIEEIRALDLRMQHPADIASARRGAASRVSAAIETILRDTEDPQDARLRAEALITRGDLNWALANLPPLPGAATQPALQLPQTPKELLQSAEDAYEQVLKKYPDQTLSAVTALFGLAAIAENRGQWDLARSHYAAILENPAAGEAFKAVAQVRLLFLTRLEEPIFTGSLTTQPATAPATTQSTS